MIQLELTLMQNIKLQRLYIKALEKKIAGKVDYVLAEQLRKALYDYEKLMRAAKANEKTNL